MKKLICLLLSSALLLTLAACGTTPTETTEAVETTEAAPDPILQERRDAAESYMRQMATYMWRATEDIIYTFKPTAETYEEMIAQSGGKTINIRAGRLYQGIPYAYCGGAWVAFQDYATEVDENGIAQVSGITWRHMNGSGAKGGRLGNDCSSAVYQAWNAAGGTMYCTSTSFMTEAYGYLPVGEYEHDTQENVLTKDVCLENGADVMFAAYAQLQKADAVVRRLESTGHTMMITDLHVEYKEDGSIDGMKSWVTVLHQTNEYIEKEKFQYSEVYGENVFITFGVDDKMSFLELMGGGYLPITCSLFQDPAPVEETWVKDSLETATWENLFEGEITSNRMIASATILVTDAQDAQVAAVTATCMRRSQKAPAFQMTQFVEDDPALLQGSLEPEALTAGAYHCVVTVRDALGNEYTVRSFDFTVD